MSKDLYEKNNKFWSRLIRWDTVMKISEECVLKNSALLTKWPWHSPLKYDCVLVA